MAAILNTSVYSFPPEIRYIAELIYNSGYEAYVVGGAVRDLLLRRDPLDVDIVVDDDPVKMAERIGGYLNVKHFILHDRHSTVRILVQPDAFDHCVVDISAMKSPILHDLDQRDFTCNALAVPIGLAARVWRLEQVIDGSGGIISLSQRILTAVSEQSFQQDPLRLLRAFRLAAELDLVIDKETIGMIRRNASLISQVASERIRDELLRVVVTSRSREFLELMSDLGVLDKLLPELTDGRGVEQPPEHQSDVLTHNLRTPGMLYSLVLGSQNPYKFAMESFAYREWKEDLLVENFSDGFSRWNFLALAGLLHDIGKPATKTTESGGKIRFLNHGIIGSEMARSLLIRLRLSSKALNFVTSVIRNHMRPSQIYVQGSLPTSKATYRYHRDLNGIAKDVLFLSLADYLAAVQANLDADDWQYRCTITNQVLNWNHQESNSNKARYVDGHDIIHEFSLMEGPIIGRLLVLLDEAVALGTVRSREQALLYLEKVQVEL